jgi:hypothetical protein
MSLSSKFDKIRQGHLDTAPLLRYGNFLRDGQNMFDDRCNRLFPEKERYTSYLASKCLGLTLKWYLKNGPVAHVHGKIFLAHIDNAGRTISCKWANIVELVYYTLVVWLRVRIISLSSHSRSLCMFELIDIRRSTRERRQ